MQRLKERLSTTLKERIDQVKPHLEQGKARVIGEIGRRAPELRDRIHTLLRDGFKVRRPPFTETPPELPAEPSPTAPTTSDKIFLALPKPDRESWRERLERHGAELRHALSWPELQRRWHAMVVWAIEHDTVPTEEVARLREKRRRRDERHEARVTMKHELDGERIKEEEEQIEVQNMYLR